MRIAAAFEKAKAEGRAALGIFITAGDPDLETSRQILMGLPESAQTDMLLAASIAAATARDLNFMTSSKFRWLSTTSSVAARKTHYSKSHRKITLARPLTPPDKYPTGARPTLHVR